MKRTCIKRVLAMLLVFSMAASFTVLPVLAEPEENAPAAIAETTETVSESGKIKAAMDYYDYRALYANIPAPVGVLATVRPADMSISSSEGMTIEPSFAGKENVLLWNSPEATVSFTVNVPAEGRYQMNMEYSPIVSANNQASLEMMMTIDGEYPFASASRFEFQKPFRVEQEWKQDSRGNDMRPAQEKIDGEWNVAYFEDSEGEYNEAYSFYFTEGVHTITLRADKVGFALSEINVLNPEKLPSYEEYRAGIGADVKVASAPVTLQAEKLSKTSDAMITANYDRSSASTEPSSYKLMLLNSMGGSKWLYAGQWAEWEIEVPEDGLYNIHMRGRQNLKSGMFVTRRIEIDGEVPFAELNDVRFPFSSSWYIKTLGDENPFEFYLTKGTHTLRMTIVPGAMEETIHVLQNSVQVLNESYRKILMITGPVPDTYRDYNLQKTVPGLLDTFAEQAAILRQEKATLEEITGTRGSEAAILETLYMQMEGFIKDPRSIQNRLSRFKSNVSSMASWLLTIREQPLELDYFSVLPAGTTHKKANAPWYSWSNISYEVMSVVASFSDKFATVGDYHDDGESLNVWVNMGRDQIQLVKELVDSDFVAKHPGIKVNVNLVQQGLVEATLAGKGPDISLFVALAEPVNLAARGALVDLSTFPDYGEVADRFYDSASTPYKYEGGVYALPATQNFSMMFYRTDIFEELGIEPPKTWDDLYEIAPIIQRQNLEIGVPSGAAAAVAADMGMFPTLIYQNGGKFYNSNLTATELDEEPALKAFTEWTQLYTRYGFPIQYDLYNRFRTGEMPLGIGAYTQYNMLSAAAPEIKGLWKMVPLPGTYVKDENGNQVYDENGEPVINRTCAGSGSQGCVILNNCKDKEAAWTFLKWFTSADVQEKFGNQIEALMGPSARYSTANKEAFKGLPWTLAEQKILIEQWENTIEIDEIPASYYIARNVSNAFRRVTNAYANPRHTLNTYNMEMNKEIKRKRQEFGLTTELPDEE